MSTQDVIAKIDANKDAFIQRLAEAVAIPSVSGAVKYRKEVYHMADWLVEQLRKVGASAELKPLGKQTLEEQEIDLPPAIFSQLGSDPNKKTLLIYGVRFRFRFFLLPPLPWPLSRRWSGAKTNLFVSAMYSTTTFNPLTSRMAGTPSLSS